MAIKFKEFKKNGAPQDDPEVRLSLQPGVDGSFDVVAVDNSGTIVKDGYLVRFRTDGVIALHPKVNAQLGFQLDATGRILQTDRLV